MRIFSIMAVAVLVASCGDGDGQAWNIPDATTDPVVLGAANPSEATIEENSPSTSGNITNNVDNINTTVSEQFAELIAAQTAAQGSGEAEPVDENTSIDNGQVSLPTTSVQNQPLADITINGSASILNDNNNDNGAITVSVRGTTARSIVDGNGNFSLNIPQLAVDQKIALDFSGEAVLGKSVPVFIPAELNSMDVNVALARRSAPITFNLEEGGVLANDGDRTSITVPPQAFILSDGTDAVGEAFVSITEADISDLYGEGSYAPELLGVGEGATEATPIITYGMAEFHFTQGGEELQLREGVTATIEMNLSDDLPIIEVEGQPPITAEVGTVIPMWHFDEENMVWTQEGAGATVFSDPDSPSGLSAAGDVSHFSWWNIDQLTPSMTAKINVVLVDSDTNEPTGDTITSFHTLARIPLSDIPGAHGEAGWSNSANLTPSNNSIQVLGNTADRETWNWMGNEDNRFTKMEIIVTQIKSPQHPNVNFGSHSKLAVFKNYTGSNTVTFLVPLDNSTPPDGPEIVGPDPETIPDPIVVPIDATVNIIFVDEASGNTIDSIVANSYQVQASSTAMNDSSLMTPTNNTISVTGNFLGTASSERVSTQITVTNIVSNDLPDYDFGTHALDRVFIQGDGNVVNIQVLVKPK